MKYAVDYGMYEAKVMDEEGNKSSLKDVNAKIEFINSLGIDDEIYLEFGSGADKFALACLKKGVKVFRLPTAVLKPMRDKDKDKDAELILKLALESSELFYKARKKDEKVLEIGLLLQKYYIVQEDIRKKAFQRLFLAEADQLLVDGEPVADLEKKLRDEIAKHPMFAGALTEEKRIYRQIDKLVREMPLFKAVFEPIKGVGGVIAGRIIYAVADIRRFPSFPTFKNYAGYGFNTDGRAQRRKKGELASWNRIFKQAVYLFCDQVVRRKEKCQPWHDILMARKAYEREKFSEIEVKNGKKFFTKGHIHNKAFRHLGQKFLKHIWTEWRRFEGIEDVSSERKSVVGGN
jgi:hypothetical protein